MKLPIRALVLLAASTARRFAGSNLLRDSRKSHQKQSTQTHFVSRQTFFRASLENGESYTVTLNEENQVSAQLAIKLIWIDSTGRPLHSP